MDKEAIELAELSIEVEMLGEASATGVLVAD